MLAHLHLNMKGHANMNTASQYDINWMSWQCYDEPRNIFSQCVL